MAEVATDKFQYSRNTMLAMRILTGVEDPIFAVVPFEPNEKKSRRNSKRRSTSAKNNIKNSWKLDEKKVVDKALKNIPNLLQELPPGLNNSNSFNLGQEPIQRRNSVPLKLSQSLSLERKESNFNVDADVFVPMCKVPDEIPTLDPTELAARKILDDVTELMKELVLVPLPAFPSVFASRYQYQLDPRVCGHASLPSLLSSLPDVSMDDEDSPQAAYWCPRDGPDRIEIFADILVKVISAAEGVAIPMMELDSWWEHHVDGSLAEFCHVLNITDLASFMGANPSLEVIGTGHVKLREGVEPHALHVRPDITWILPDHFDPTEMMYMEQPPPPPPPVMDDKFFKRSNSIGLSLENSLKPAPPQIPHSYVMSTKPLSDRRVSFSDGFAAQANAQPFVACGEYMEPLSRVCLHNELLAIVKRMCKHQESQWIRGEGYTSSESEDSSAEGESRLDKRKRKSERRKRKKERVRNSERIPDHELTPEQQVRRQGKRNKMIGVLVSLVKTEWDKCHEYPLTYYMNSLGIKKVKHLLLEVPDMILVGSGGYVRATARDHAKRFCNPYPPPNTIEETLFTNDNLVHLVALKINSGDQEKYRHHLLCLMKNFIAEKSKQEQLAQLYEQAHTHKDSKAVELLDSYSAIFQKSNSESFQTKVSDFLKKLPAARGVPVSDLKKEWLSAYKVDLQTLMDKAGYAKVSSMVDDCSDIMIVDKGPTMRVVLKSDKPQLGSRHTIGHVNYRLSKSQDQRKKIAMKPNITSNES